MHSQSFWLKKSFLFLGCKNGLINVEARPLDSKFVTRRCVVARFKDFTIERYKDIAGQNAGGVLLLLPQELHELSEEGKQVNMVCMMVKNPYVDTQLLCLIYRIIIYTFNSVSNKGICQLWKVDKIKLTQDQINNELIKFINWCILLQHFHDLEGSLLQEEDAPLPVYFAVETPELLEIYEDINRSVHSDEASSGAEGMCTRYCLQALQHHLK